MSNRRTTGWAFILSVALAGCGDDGSAVAGSGGSAGASGVGGSAGTAGTGGAAGSAGEGGTGGSMNERPDLIVRGIGPPMVACPGGGGTCVTTVDVAIENVGDAVAPAFEFEVTLDPAQGVVVTQSVAAGLPPGFAQFFTIVTPQGDNCFDPDCTISVFVDHLNDVFESDENNNMGMATTDG